MMENIRKKVFLIILVLFFGVKAIAQTDYSALWEDYYSYNNVKDIVKNGEDIFSLVDNAIFSYNISTKELEKTSSINGMSGEVTSAIAFSSSLNKIIIGYENGLLDIINSDGTIDKVVDILISDVSSEKGINSIYEIEGKVYLSMNFGIVVYDLNKLEFIDTYFIGNNSSDVIINNIVIHDGIIYASCAEGIYSAFLNSNLNDFENWDLNLTGSYSILKVFNDTVLASKGSKVYKVLNRDSEELVITANATLLDIEIESDKLMICTSKQSFVYNTTYQQLYATSSGSNTISSVLLDGDTLFQGSSKQGLLVSNVSAINSFEEIHPVGPKSNDIFSITVKNNHLWLVYGGYTEFYTPIATRADVTHYNGADWNHIPFSSFNATGLVHVTVDPDNIDKVYVSSWSQTNGTPSNRTGGVLVIEDNQFVDFWNQSNSGLDEVFPNNANYVSVRVDGTAFDNQGNFWATSSLAPTSILKKRSPEGVWTDHDLTIEGLISDMNQLIVDKKGNIWIGSRGNGLLVYNPLTGENAQLNDGIDTGNLEHMQVRTIACDKNNHIWLGTFVGLFRFDHVENVFNETFKGAEPVIIIDDGQNKKLLGDSTINTILIDGADNKWFGTSAGGVLQTNSSGRKTLAQFNKDNSPLPSNYIRKIQIDETTGKVYFLTEKGIVSYKSNIAAYGEELTEVYGYPNPAYKHQHEISITGKDGASLPYGTNVKILDVAGNLVFESNTIETQSEYGGKIVWNKKNLAGVQVASGVYIVLLYNETGSQTSSTKIAVIN